MNLKISKTTALALVGLTVYASLVTSAFATPPKTKKHTTKKPIKKTDPSVQIAQGKKVYAANGCKGCHSIDGQGGKSGPELTRVGADSKHTTAWLITHVETPTAQTPESSMPAYKGKIKQADLTALAVYLGSLKK